MNRAIPDEIVDEIRSRCNIVDIIGSYIPLKKAGHGTWKALCPFHQEKTPSFNISEQNQHYHCFGCGKGGDVFSFVMEREGVDFPNAIHLLASKCSVVIPEKTYTNPEERRQAQEHASQRERIYAINEEFAAWYAAQLREHPESPVAQYLLTRGIPDDIAARFRIGAAPDSWDASFKHGTALGFSEHELFESGILTSNENSGKIYDRFRNRLIFPIWNEQGKVVAFSARTIEKNSEGAKYVNSPETPVFKKGNILYALPLARQDIQKLGFVILCEGQLDVIAMHRAGNNETSTSHWRAIAMAIKGHRWDSGSKGFRHVFSIRLEFIAAHDHSDFLRPNAGSILRNAVTTNVGIADKQIHIKKCA